MDPMCNETGIVLFEQLLEEWLYSTKMRVKESTYARYVHLIRTHIQPALGSYPLSRFTTRVVESFILQQLESGRLDGKGGLSSKTVSDMLVIIKSTVDFAQYKGLAISCPLNKLTIRKRETEIRVFSRQEQRMLVKVLTHEMDPCKFGVLLALYTGIRIGELCALKWENVNMSQGMLMVRKNMQRIQATELNAPHKTGVILTEPKSKCSSRDIPLPTFLLSFAKQFSRCPQAYVLTGDPTRFMEPRTLQNRFKTYVAKSGIREANFHATRHTFATRCVEVGFDSKSLSEILGHSNVNITLNRYVHPSLALKRSNMDKLQLIP